MPRHNLTNIDASGLGEQVASSFKVKAGKSNIWNPDVKADMTLNSVLHQTRDKTVQFTTTSCAVEYMRMLKTNELRKRLNRLRLKHRNETNVNGLLPAVTALERWFMRYQLENSERIARGEVSGDPVIPTVWSQMNAGKKNNEKVTQLKDDAGLIGDLMIAKDSKVVATLVASDIRDEAHQISIELLKSTNKEKTDRKNNMVLIERHRHTIDVLFHQKLLKINPLHYDKLKMLFDQTVGGGGGGGEDSAANSSTHDTNNDPKKVAEEQAAVSKSCSLEQHNDMFHQCLFCVLARYHTIQGHGFQAAVCEQAFDCLFRHLKVSFECFASPLNSRYGQYCSAFPDTDACFGSLGSFFQFFPTSGSFEANPPFEPTVMLKMIHHIHTLLDSSKDALSFVIIVPGWMECESWDVMDNSKYKVREVELLAKDDHGFCDGASHQRRDRYRDSCFDTAIFFLQNDKGRVVYQVTERCIDEFRVAMAQGKPSPAMRLRQEKEGRGTADVCRGVYKGKKRNATGEGVMARKAMEKALRSGQGGAEGGGGQRKKKKRKGNE